MIIFHEYVLLNLKKKKFEKGANEKIMNKYINKW